MTHPGGVALFRADRLRSLRLEQGISFERLAVAIDRSYSSIIQYESGAVTPPAPIVERLAHALDVGVDDLLDGEIAA
jgi:transcriptional regulator with XRE-family HTH domain